MFVRLAAVLVVLLLLAVMIPAHAQDMPTPSINVGDQLSLNSRVRMTDLYSDVRGFIVIHADDGAGNFGPPIGHEDIQPGWTFNLEVPIDVTQATLTLFAMLHVDDNTAGVYEFGSVEGADAPVVSNGSVVAAPFQVTLIGADDQFVEDGHVSIASVVTSEPGWLVIHAGDASSFGAVLGQTLVNAGVNRDVVVSLADEGRTDVLWPMLHHDTGAVGEYEFGSVEGADLPVVVNDGPLGAARVAVTPFWTVPHIRANNQNSLPGDGEPVRDMGYVLVIQSVFAAEDGFLVIHQEQNGGPGPVAGVLPVPAGLSKGLVVQLDPAMVTPRLWPMLHVDTGTIGQYEFGTVEGTDGPVMAGGGVVTFQLNASPSMILVDQVPAPGMTPGTIQIVIAESIIDAQGWIAIHSNNNGQPGPVIATALVHDYSSKNTVIEVDAAAAGDLVFPMLHYDTGELGVYEFGTVEGADAPVRVGGNVVVAPLNLLPG